MGMGIHPAEMRALRRLLFFLYQPYCSICSSLGSFSGSSLIDLWCEVEEEGQLASYFSICEDFLFFVKAAFVVFSWEFSSLSSLVYCCFNKGQ